MGCGLDGRRSPGGRGPVVGPYPDRPGSRHFARWFSEVDIVEHSLPGSIVTYTITLSNDGATPVSSLLVTDALPDEVSYVPLSAHSVPEGAGIPSFDIPNYRNITFTVASVPGNSDVQLVFRASGRFRSRSRNGVHQHGLDQRQRDHNDSQRLGRGGSTSVSRNQEPLGQPTHHHARAVWRHGRAWTDDQYPDFRASPWYP